jgi:small GTP-binding protein|tara:strand:+ start:123 stop:770 length:648 start_codon:yes stop_codon:yes gene_type:complete|eukprot:g4301.t1
MNPNANTSPKLKILTIGNSAVGKTCLLYMFADGGFNDSHLITFGFDYKKKEVELNGKPYSITLWDTAGQERFHTITFAYFRGCHGMLLVYDVTNEKSFEKIEYWMKKIKEKTENTPSGAPPQVILVGNKSDLENSLTGNQRVISYEQGLAAAKKHGIEFIETSAKTNKNVEEAFMLLLKKIVDSGMVDTLQNGQRGQQLRGASGVDNGRQKKSCC